MTRPVLRGYAAAESWGTVQTQAGGGRLSRRVVVGGLAGLGVSAAGLVLLGGCQVASPAVSPRGRAKIPRLGYLSLGPREEHADQMDAFLEGLRDLGYVEGQTIDIEWRF